MSFRAQTTTLDNFARRIESARADIRKALPVKTIPTNDEALIAKAEKLAKQGRASLSGEPVEHSTAYRHSFARHYARLKYEGLQPEPEPSEAEQVAIRALQSFYKFRDAIETLELATVAAVIQAYGDRCADKARDDENVACARIIQLAAGPYVRPHAEVLNELAAVLRNRRNGK